LDGAVKGAGADLGAKQARQQHQRNYASEEYSTPADRDHKAKLAVHF
jgi:hypothetical protein